MADYAIHEETLTDVADVIRKKDGTSALIDPADYADRINLMGMLEEKTVSGAIATFADGADAVPLKKCEITLPASLDGYSSVDIIHAGKNLWEFGVQTVDTVAYIMLYFTKPLPAGTYTISCELISTTTTCSFRFRKEDGSYLVQTAFTANAGRVSQTLTLPEPAYRVYIYSSTQAGGEVTTWKNVQIEVGATMTDFEAYETPTTHTANLGRTIHGGKSDVVNGTGTDENGKFTVTSDMSDAIRYIGSGDTAYIQINKTPASNGRWQDLECSHFTPANIYAGGTQQGIGCYSSQFYIRDSQFASKQDFLDFLDEQETLGTPLEICYKLANPTEFTFDGQEINTRLGYNAFWSDEGDTEVTYRSSGTVYQYPEGEGVSF